MKKFLKRFIGVLVTTMFVFGVVCFIELLYSSFIVDQYTKISEMCNSGEEFLVKEKYNIDCNEYNKYIKNSDGFLLIRDITVVVLKSIGVLFFTILLVEILVNKYMKNNVFLKYLFISVITGLIYIIKNIFDFNLIIILCFVLIINILIEVFFIKKEKDKVFMVKSFLLTLILSFIMFLSDIIPSVIRNIKSGYGWFDAYSYNYTWIEYLGFILLVVIIVYVIYYFYTKKILSKINELLGKEKK